MAGEALKSGLEYPLIHCPEKGHGKKWCYHNSEIMTELKNQMRLSGPLVVVSFLQYSLQMISVMFVGRLGELSLASASLATSFAGVTGFGFMVINKTFSNLSNNMQHYSLNVSFDFYFYTFT